MKANNLEPTKTDLIKLASELTEGDKSKEELNSIIDKFKVKYPNYKNIPPQSSPAEPVSAEEEYDIILSIADECCVRRDEEGHSFAEIIRYAISEIDKHRGKANQPKPAGGKTVWFIENENQEWYYCKEESKHNPGKGFHDYTTYLIPSWTKDPLQAKRFDLKEYAEQFAKGDTIFDRKGKYTITEHEFVCSPKLSQPLPDSGREGKSDAVEFIEWVSGIVESNNFILNKTW